MEWHKISSFPLPISLQCGGIGFSRTLEFVSSFFASHHSYQMKKIIVPFLFCLPFFLPPLFSSTKHSVNLLWTPLTAISKIYKLLQCCFMCVFIPVVLLWAWLHDFCMNGGNSYLYTCLPSQLFSFFFFGNKLSSMFINASNFYSFVAFTPASLWFGLDMKSVFCGHLLRSSVYIILFKSVPFPFNLVLTTRIVVVEDELL